LVEGFEEVVAKHKKAPIRGNVLEAKSKGDPLIMEVPLAFVLAQRFLTIHKQIAN
jgi:hypothetical protein